MSSKRVRLISLLGVVLIILVVAAGFIMTYAARDARVLSLPSSTGNAPGTTGVLSADGGLFGSDRVAVTSDNVQNVIATLVRPSEYSRTVVVESAYSGGSATSRISTVVLNGSQALIVETAGSRKHIVITGGSVYIWYNGEKNPREMPFEASGDDRTVLDSYQMLLTYEDVLSLDKSSITDAVYDTYAGEGCISVTFKSPLLGYKTVCHIAVASGLLIGAEQYDGQKLVYRQTAMDYTASADKAAFTLPDGTNPVSPH
ncbi:hypothetical protein AAFA46_02355 [Oscillospiraceae bacterium WX1]